MYRNTYVEINLKNLRSNVEKLVNTYNEYLYHFGVVKADCYGHGGEEVVKTIVEAGCNYLAVATLEEAVSIRQYLKDIPILCLGIIDIEYLDVCLENDITVTISSLSYLKKLLERDLPNLKVHIKLNTGMNRLGVNKRSEFNQMVKLLKESNVILEGIYTHFYSPLDEESNAWQYRRFKEITRDVDLSQIPIIHLGASDETISWPKYPESNGCRLGIAMYGLVQNTTIKLESTFSLHSEVIQINDVCDATVGYNGAYKANGQKRIAVVPIGYADGIIRKNTGRYVYINDKRYQIVGNICMDMLFVKVDNTVKVKDEVVLIKDNDHILEIAKHLDTIPYEVICSIGKRVPRIYIK